MDKEEYAENVLINLGLWNNETSKNIEQIEKRIDNLKVELFENFMNPTSQKKSDII